MSQLQLTTEEEETLHDLLTNRLTELEVEILHTDHSAFRDLLKHRRELLARIVQRLAQSNEMASSV
jgi:EAL domain-containing protein (putative c-di-GMP-specific phosphodiesterase class I)